MIYAVKVLSNLVIIFIFIRATCKILHMRSQAAYATIILALMVISYYTGPFQIPNVIRILVISPLSLFILPVLMSEGSLKTRVTRTLLLAAVVMCSEFAAAGTYWLLTGSIGYPAETDTWALAPFIASYMVCILFILVAMEGVIAFCRWDSDSAEASLQTPMLILIVLTHLAGAALIMRMYVMRNGTGLALVGTFFINLLTLAAALATQDLAQRELRAGRRAADQASLVRQSRHLKSEILSITSSSVATRKLRHDVANQIGIIDELLEQGRIGAAESYMSALQDRARMLADF